MRKPSPPSRKAIPALAFLAAAAACFPISSIAALPRFWPFFYATGFALSLAHWLALARLSDLLFAKKPAELVVVGSLAFLTLALELALCFAAIKIVRVLLLPSAIAIVIVPASVTAYCLAMGLFAIIRNRKT